RRSRSPPRPPVVPYTTLFRSDVDRGVSQDVLQPVVGARDTVALRILMGPLPLAAQDGHDAAIGLRRNCRDHARRGDVTGSNEARSEEHTSELQSQSNLVCRLL